MYSPAAVVAAAAAWLGIWACISSDRPTHEREATRQQAEQPAQPESEQEQPQPLDQPPPQQLGKKDRPDPQTQVFEPEPEPEPDPEPPRLTLSQQEQSIDSLASLFKSSAIDGAELDQLAEQRAVRLAVQPLSQLAAADTATSSIADLLDCMSLLRGPAWKRPTRGQNAILDLAAGPLLDAAAACPALGLWACRLLESESS
eukprot:COSAG06_NODE_13164_length_1287_cov_0.938552_1_plen_200_part_10